MWIALWKSWLSLRRRRISEDPISELNEPSLSCSCLVSGSAMVALEKRRQAANDQRWSGKLTITTQRSRARLAPSRITLDVV
jgi:hypothetical protein